MAPPRRDHRLIDAVERIGPSGFSGTVWRVVRSGRDPGQCSASGGRWDDGRFEVLYTALTADGAIAELDFHLRRGQPLPPSRVRYGLHALGLTLRCALELPTLDTLAALGVDTERFGQLSYPERGGEYPRSRDIAEAAHFLEFDGLMVPSARWDGRNAVVFCDRVPAQDRRPVKDHGAVDFRAWAARRAR